MYEVNCVGGLPKCSFFLRKFVRKGKHPVKRHCKFSSDWRDKGRDLACGTRPASCLFWGWKEQRRWFYLTFKCVVGCGVLTCKAPVMRTLYSFQVTFWRKPGYNYIRIGLQNRYNYISLVDDRNKVIIQQLLPKTVNKYYFTQKNNGCLWMKIRLAMYCNGIYMSFKFLRSHKLSL